MVTSQSHRGDSVQAWWAHTGSTNRGFVSLDPERQREADTGGRPAARKPAPGGFGFDVCRLAAKDRPARGKAAPKGPPPADAGAPGVGDTGTPPRAGRRRG